MRRTLFIIAIIVVIAGLGTAVYFLFFATTAGITVAPQGGTNFPSAGSSGTGTSTSTTSTAGTTASGVTTISSRLVEIDKGPVVAGEVAFDVTSTSTGSTTKDVDVQYLNRESGNIFSYLWGAGTLTRISNRTIPGIENAVWLASGATAFVQYLSGTDNSTVNTYALPANSSGGFFLPQDIAGIAVGGNSLLYVASGDNGSVATLERVTGVGSSQAFTTPLSSIEAQFSGAKYLVYTKPSAALGGYAFIVSGGVFAQIAGPLDGLVALASPSGNWALVSYSVSGVMKMELINLKTHSVTALPVATIADKCVWSADESAVYCGIPNAPSTSYAYPDDWYQGAVHFSDSIWKIDVNARVAELVLNFSSAASASLDATNLAIDPLQKVLVFRNKNNGSLWAYAL